MDIKIKESGDVTIIDFIGRLDTATSPAAESEINKILERGCNRVLINLKGLEWVSSSGLRVLLVTAKKLSVIKGKLRICEPNEVVNEILEISGFSSILNVRVSAAEALSELQF
jgi:anti-sigma B factor antagonist